MRNDLFLLTGICCALLAAALTGLVVAGWQPLVAFDGQVGRDLHAHAVSHPGTTRLMQVLSDWVWDPWTCAPGRRRRGPAVAARRPGPRPVRGTGDAGRLGGAAGHEAAVGRERPVWPDPVDSASFAAFPSGHAMTAAVVCGLLLWLLPRPAPRWAAAAWALAVVSVLGVGFTRLYLGVHWFSDVLAGWLLGVALVVLAVRVTVRRRDRSPVGR